MRLSSARLVSREVKFIWIRKSLWCSVETIDGCTKINKKKRYATI